MPYGKSDMRIIDVTPTLNTNEYAEVMHCLTK